MARAPRVDPVGIALTPASWRHRRSDLIAVAALLVLVALVAWDRIWLERGLNGLDNSTEFLPWYAYLGEALRHFDVPGWNPHQFSGTPFAGDPESGWMYLPSMLCFALLPALMAYKVFFLLHFLVAALSTYALARLLGMGAVAGVVAGAAFVCGQYLYATDCCSIRVQLATWLPLALIGVEVAVRGRSWTRRAAGWGVTGFCLSQMLAGWLGAGAYYGFLIVGGYLAYRTLVSPPAAWTFRERVMRCALDGAAILAAGLALGAAGLLPRLDVVRATNLAGGEYQGRDSRGGGWDLILLLDRLLSYDDSRLVYYAGGATVALALLAPLLAGRRQATPYFAALSLLTVTLMLRPTPVHRLFYLLPRFQVLHEHVPSRIQAVLPLSLAMLAGASVASLPYWGRRRWAAAAGLIPLAALGGVTALLHSHARSIGRPTVAAVAVVGVVVAVAAVCTRPWLRSRLPRDGAVPVAMALLAATVIWDPVGARLARSLRDPHADPTVSAALTVNAASTDPGGAGEFLQARLRDGEPFRFFGYDPALQDGADGGYRLKFRNPLAQALLVNARPLRLGLYDVQGYNPMHLTRYDEFIAALNGATQNYHDAQVLESGIDSPLLNLLNVRYIIVPVEVPPGRSDLSRLSRRYPTVFANSTIRVLENDAALPHAWIVHDARQVEPGDALDLLAAEAVDPRTTALLEDAPPVLEVPPDPSSDAVVVRDYGADSIRLDARTGAAGLLMLSEIDAPGWRAYVDGERVPIYVADHVLRAVPLSAGEHVVELRYEPRSLQAGLLITILGYGALVGLGLVAAWRRFRRGASRLNDVGELSHAKHA